MDLTREQMARAGQYAKKLVEPHIEEYKPARIAWLKDTGSVRALTFKGSAGDEIVILVLLRWFYSSYGAVGKEPAGVHVRLKLYRDEQQRWRMHFVEMHADATSYERGKPKVCSTCGDGFVEDLPIVNDTDLWEY